MRGKLKIENRKEKRGKKKKEGCHRGKEKSYTESILVRSQSEDFGADLTGLSGPELSGIGKENRDGEKVGVGKMIVHI